MEVTLRENPDFDPTLKHDCLMFWMSFRLVTCQSLKRFGYIAGFKLKLLTIYQNISQLNEIYGVEGAKTLMSAHPCRIIYAVSEEDDAKRFRKSWAISPPNRQVQARQADAQRRKAVQKVRRSALVLSQGWERWILKKNLSFLKVKTQS